AVGFILRQLLKRAAAGLGLARSRRTPGSRRTAIISPLLITGIDDASWISDMMMILEVAPMVAVTMRFVLSVAAVARSSVLAAFTMVMSTASSHSRGRQGNHRGNGSVPQNHRDGHWPVHRHLHLPVFRGVGMLTGRAHDLMPSVRRLCAKSHTVDMRGVSGPAKRRPVDSQCLKTRMLARSIGEADEYRSARVHLGAAR